MTDLDPLVAAVLAVTPLDLDGEVITGFDASDMPEYGPPEPIAAKQAAAVLRWLAQAKRDGEQGCWCHRCLDDLADDLDPPKENSDANA